jgi:hypothetical protein
MAANGSGPGALSIEGRQHRTTAPLGHGPGHLGGGNPDNDPPVRRLRRRRWTYPPDRSARPGRGDSDAFKANSSEVGFTDAWRSSSNRRRTRGQTLMVAKTTIWLSSATHGDALVLRQDNWTVDEFHNLASTTTNRHSNSEPPICSGTAPPEFDLSSVLRALHCDTRRSTSGLPHLRAAEPCLPRYLEELLTALRLSPDSKRTDER